MCTACRVGHSKGPTLAQLERCSHHSHTLLSQSIGLLVGAPTQNSPPRRDAVLQASEQLATRHQEVKLELTSSEKQDGRAGKPRRYASSARLG